jgi:acyl-CoA thioesterase
MKTLAQKVAEYMAGEDRVLRALNICLEEVDVGYARMTLKISKDMLNGFGIGHGGITFTLADTAFAFACNSRNRLAVAASCTIKFKKMVYEGDVLTATAIERSLADRSGLYDVTITNQEKDIVATFEGCSRTAHRRVCAGLNDGDDELV